MLWKQEHLAPMPILTAIRRFRLGMGPLNLLLLGLGGLYLYAWLRQSTPCKTTCPAAAGPVAVPQAGKHRPATMEKAATNSMPFIAS